MGGPCRIRYLSMDYEGIEMTNHENDRAQSPSRPEAGPASTYAPPYFYLCEGCGVPLWEGDVPADEPGCCDDCPPPQTGHTPGPWRAGLTFMAEPGYVVAGEGETFQIVARINPERREANASLIAAAPDLLAAATDALESLRRLPDAPDAYRVTCIAQLIRAIARATGE